MVKGIMQSSAHLPAVQAVLHRVISDSLQEGGMASQWAGNPWNHLRTRAVQQPSVGQKSHVAVVANEVACIFHPPAIDHRYEVHWWFRVGFIDVRPCRVMYQTFRKFVVFAWRHLLDREWTVLESTEWSKTRFLYFCQQRVNWRGGREEVVR